MNAPNTAQTLARGLAVLRCFSERPEMSVSEIALMSGLGRQVTQRLVNTLVEDGFLVRSASSSRYRLGLESIILGHHARHALPIRAHALPFMADIARSSGMTVNLNVLEPKRWRAICVESIDGLDKARFNMHLGSSSSLLLGASRKVILAHLDEADRRSAAASAGRKIDEALCRQLERFREDGWAVTRGESQPRAIGCAVPLLRRERAMGSLSALAMTTHLTEDDVARVVDDLMEAAKQINDRLAMDAGDPRLGRGR